ncbi:MAG: sugar phosphate nucleotidyltransferase [Candidatus Marinimicrobia bacterium]|nr:sugar phosphate nucleotidyltransferase [Candidatus Neomarinimicrobiota bacterium]
MKAVIPAAGIGKRLQPLTLTRPKVLLPVAGKPILGHILDKVIESGIDEIVLIVGYKGDMVSDYVRKHYPMDVRFVEQKERKGLGHAVGIGLDDIDEPVLIILGDTILDLDFDHFVKSKKNIIGVMEVADPRRFGIVELDSDRVKRLVEKPKEYIGNLAIAGIYLLQHENILKKAIQHIVDHNITTKNEYQLTDALQVMLDWQQEMTVETINACYDCGTRETLLDTNRILLKTIGQQPYSFEKTVIIPPVYIGQDVRIENSVIGPYVSIADKTTISQSIIEDTIIDSGSVIQTAILKNSLIGQDAHVSGPGLSIDIGDKTRHDLG